MQTIETESFTDTTFDRTFDEGMALVEETARYLDGKGREEARVLPRKAAMLYAGESMRVTTRLMQAASWLLVQRAVRDGDMEAEQALGERYRLGSKEICLGACAESTEMLPVALGGAVGSVTEAGTYDMEGVSSTGRRRNGPGGLGGSLGAGPRSVVVSGWGMGHTASSGRAQVGASSCEGSVWQSETAVVCYVAVGIGGSGRVVVTSGVGGGSDGRGKGR